MVKSGGAPHRPSGSLSSNAPVLHAHLVPNSHGGRHCVRAARRSTPPCTHVPNAHPYSLLLLSPPRTFLLPTARLTAQGAGNAEHGPAAVVDLSLLEAGQRRGVLGQASGVCGWGKGVEGSGAARGRAAGHDAHDALATCPLLVPRCQPCRAHLPAIRALPRVPAEGTGLTEAVVAGFSTRRAERQAAAAVGGWAGGGRSSFSTRVGGEPRWEFREDTGAAREREVEAHTLAPFQARRAVLKTREQRTVAMAMVVPKRVRRARRSRLFGCPAPATLIPPSPFQRSRAHASRACALCAARLSPGAEHTTASGLFILLPPPLTQSGRP